MKNNIIQVFTKASHNNIAFHVSNDKQEVINTRINICKKFNFNYDNLKYMNQVHSNDVVVVNDHENIYECDALITNKKDTPLMVMVADCIPILFYDEIDNVIAVAHAGRNGTFLNISKNVISKMNNEFLCKIKNIKVILGPSIQKCCYEVSKELEDIAIKNFGDNIASNRYIDLQQINKNSLLKIGIKEENISICKVCTKCSDEDYFSYRKDKFCGRFSGIISIK